MTGDEILSALEESLEDRRLSRNERQALIEIFANLRPEDRPAVRRLAFELARATLLPADDRAVIDWLEGVVRTLEPPDTPPMPPDSEAWFSPGDDCAQRIGAFIREASVSLDVCVFTITDDRITDELIAAHRRKVSVRIASDDDKANDLGSDVERLEACGVPVRLDRSAFHMHHKFALVDRQRLLTGSYNWTRGAARDNQENFVITSDPRLVEAFARTFDRFWKLLG